MEVYQEFPIILQQIDNDLYITDCSIAISEKILTWCDQLSQESRADYVRIQVVTVPFLVSATTSKDKTELAAANILHRIGLNFTNNNIIDVSLEDTSAHGIVGILLESVFQSELLLSYKWANGQLNKNGGIKPIVKPDFIVFVSQSNRCYDLSTSETKSPSNPNPYNDSESDLIKLGKEMKSMLDILIQSGVQFPVVVGIFRKGH